MQKVLVVALCGMMSLAVWGCKNHHKEESKSTGSTTKSTADACSHCPGVQTATSAGKCPVCKS